MNDDLEALYRATGNPIYAWKALADYGRCPDGAPLPPWVQKYVREAALMIEALADFEPPSRAAASVNVALGISGSDRKNAFSDYRQDIRGMNAAHVHENRHEMFGPQSRRKEYKSDEWLEDTLGLGSKQARRQRKDPRSRQVGALIARGQKLKEAIKK